MRCLSREKFTSSFLVEKLCGAVISSSSVKYL